MRKSLPTQNWRVLGTTMARLAGLQSAIVVRADALTQSWLHFFAGSVWPQSGALNWRLPSALWKTTPVRSRGASLKLNSSRLLSATASATLYTRSTVTLTTLPGATFDPAAGSWALTWFAFTLASAVHACAVSVPNISFASPATRAAWGTVSPVRSGTLTAASCVAAAVPPARNESSRRVTNGVAIRQVNRCAGHTLTLRVAGSFGMTVMTWSKTA